MTDTQTNQQAGHTPGPWLVGDRYGEDALMSASGEEVAYAAWAGGSNCNLAFSNEANARLIAASPSMYLIVANRAACGDSDAISLMEAINGNS